MNELAVEKTVTTKELAEVLGVDRSTITRAIQAVNENLCSTAKVVIQNGKPTFLTEKQATLIKQEIQKHHNLATRQIDSVSTEEEENLVVARAISIVQRRAEEFRRRAELAEAKVIEQAPKVEFYDAVTESPDTIDIGQVAKILNIKGIGRNKLFDILREKGILDRHNQPYQNYVNAGYFRIVETAFDLPDGTHKINLKTVVFQKGINYIRKLVEA